MITPHPPPQRAVPLPQLGKAIAAASWAYNVPSIREFMKQNCDYFLETIEDLHKLLFEE